MASVRISALITVFGDLISANGTFDKISRVSESGGEPSDGRPMDLPDASIRLEQVDFGYGDHLILKNLSCVIPTRSPPLQATTGPAKPPCSSCWSGCTSPTGPYPLRRPRRLPDQSGLLAQRLCPGVPGQAPAVGNHPGKYHLRLQSSGLRRGAGAGGPAGGHLGLDLLPAPGL